MVLSQFCLTLLVCFFPHYIHFCHRSVHRYIGSTAQLILKHSKKTTSARFKDMKTHCGLVMFHSSRASQKSPGKPRHFHHRLRQPENLTDILRVGERLDGSNSTELCPTDVDNKYARCTFSGIIYMQIYLYIFLEIHHIYIILHLYHQRHNDISLITSISYNFYIYFLDNNLHHALV